MNKAKGRRSEGCRPFCFPSRIGYLPRAAGPMPATHIALDPGAVPGVSTRFAGTSNLGLPFTGALQGGCRLLNSGGGQTNAGTK